MKYIISIIFFILLSSQSLSAETPKVELKTSMGNILIELYPEKAPLTVANFLQYVEDKFYDGTIFHRVVPGFVVQGGGFTFDFQQKKTRKPINNEAKNGLKNSMATLSMARTRAPHSATSQFFINIVDNAALDPNPSSDGYAVFGKVIKGFDIVKKIEEQPRGIHRMHPEAPNYAIIIEKAYVVDKEGKTEQKGSASILESENPSTTSLDKSAE